MIKLKYFFVWVYVSLGFFYQKYCRTRAAFEMTKYTSNMYWLGHNVAVCLHFLALVILKYWTICIRRVHLVNCALWCRSNCNKWSQKKRVSQIMMQSWSISSLNSFLNVWVKNLIMKIYFHFLFPGNIYDLFSRTWNNEPYINECRFCICTLKRLKKSLLF